MTNEINNRHGWAYHDDVEVRHRQPKRLLSPSVWRLLALALLLLILAAGAVLSTTDGSGMPLWANDTMGRDSGIYALWSIKPPPLPRVPE